ncbi:MAG: glycosyltransferase family 4 protein [Phycisphaerales bacterium]|nr:MAG: glycosyltransferase family 4 protein [Phycisphaerales bacterium]
MTKVRRADTAETRKSTRPVLIASRRTITEHTTYLQRLLLGLADESITTALVCPPSCSLERLTPVPADVFTHPLIDLPLMEGVGIETLAVHLEKFRPTVLHCLCESRATLVRRLAERLEVPYVLAVNSLERKVARLSVSPTHCASIIVPAETIRVRTAKFHVRYADRIRQINMGTFAGAEPVCFSDPSRLSSIVVAHPLDHVSHFESLFKATGELIGDGHEFMTVIMGRGRAEHRLRRLLVEYGLSEVITIVPVLDAWRAAVAAGDIFLQPLPNAAFSVALLEAMGLGAAVIACSGGVDDLIVPNQTALVFEPDSERGLRDSLARLLGDHNFARRLASTAQTYVAGRYPVSGMVAATLETYMEAQRNAPASAR